MLDFLGFCDRLEEMTILHASEILLNWFRSRDSFNFKDNFKELMPNYLSETPEADKASIQCSLKSLEENGMLKSTKIGNEEYFVLIRPFETMEQNVTIGYNTISILTEVTKKAAERFDNKELLINPLNVTEKDILLTLNILMDAVKKSN